MTRFEEIRSKLNTFGQIGVGDAQWLLSQIPDSFSSDPLVRRGTATVIEVPHRVEDNVVVAINGEEVVNRNTVGELELVEVLREALEKRMADRNAKQTTKGILSKENGRS